MKKKPIAKIRTYRHRKTTIIGIVIAAIALSVYGYFQTTALRTGPYIEITEYHDWQTFYKSHIVLQGDSARAAYIELNGREIFITEEGTFSEDIVLSPGINYVTVYAKDRYNKVRQVTHTYYYDDSFEKKRLEEGRRAEEESGAGNGAAPEPAAETTEPISTATDP